MAQLDLFLDSRAVMLAKEAAECLLARDAQGAASALAELKREDPAYPAAGALSLLLQFASEWQPLPRHAFEIARAAGRLEDIAPAASLALGERGRPFVQRYHLELAAAGAALPYDQAHPEAHPAPAAAADVETASSHPSPACTAARLVASILDREREGSSQVLIGLRRRLRDLNDDLFALYMQRRTVFHR